MCPMKMNFNNIDDMIIGVIYNNQTSFIVSIGYWEKFLIDNAEFINSIVIHNLIGFSELIKNKIIKWFDEKRVFCYIHDYSWVCKNYNLMFNDEEYCRVEWHKFLKCKKCRNNTENLSLRTFTTEIFKADNVKIICPSDNVKQRLKVLFKIFDESKLIVLPHQSYISVNNKFVSNKKIKIAYVGYQSYIKGWEVFKDITINNNNYEFYVLGYASEKLDNVKYIDVSFQKNGDNDMVDKLLENKIDIAFLWSIWPETYSFTYYESSAAGVFVITNLLSGNIANQVESNRNGIVFKNEDELKKILNNESYLSKLLLKNRYKIKDLTLNKVFYSIIMNSECYNKK
jgi:hypothetical protein